MKKIFFLFILIYTSISYSQTVKADNIIGTWLTGNGKAKVQITKSGDKYNGKIVWLKEPNYPDGTPKVDKNNPDKTKQKNPILGLSLLKDFVWDDDQWEDGTIYDPENGKTYSCKIEMKSGALEVRGYIGFSLIGRTQIWVKVKETK